MMFVVSKGENMKIVQINTTCGAGSTGKICSAIASLLDQNHVENYIFYSSGRSFDSHGKKYLSSWDEKLQALCSHIYGNYGFNTFFATKRLLKELDAISPDVVHLHNIHGHNANLELLFNYFKKNPNIKIYWTFHDCWAFTGYCTHFTIEKCDKWISGCHNCPQYRKYSYFFDRSDTLYNRKKELFTGLDMTIITPSKWMAGLVSQSFLKDYPIKVINNGIDLSIFQPKSSNFKAKYNISTDKYILLGVAFSWGTSKGLDVFIELADKLPEKYQIVLVGTNKEIDRQLPNNIISIHRTKNQSELAEIYSAADLLINPTREETYPTVNMESIACGTPVLTFCTGGSPEILDETCGCVVDCDDKKALKNEVIRISTQKSFSLYSCLKKAKAFNANERFREYTDLYAESATMKKILFFIPTLLGGGAEKVLVDLVNNLNSKKYDITVLTLDTRGVYKNSINKNIKLKTINNYKNPFIKKLFNVIICKYLPSKFVYKKYIADKYDVEIAFLEGIATKILAASTNDNKIAWVHTDLFNYLDCYKKIKNSDKLYKSFKKVICVSNSVKDNFRKQYGFDDNVLIQYNPIDEKNIIEKSKEVINEFAISSKFKIVTVGRLEYQKGYDRLLNVHKKLIEDGLDYELWILGDGTQRAEMEHYISENNLSDTVKLLGFQKNPYKFLSKADIFVSSSRIEGFSLVVAEALILGLPIISTDSIGPAELLKNGEFGMICENNENGLYESIKKIVLDDDLREKYKNQSHKRSEFIKLANTIKEIEKIIDME